MSFLNWRTLAVAAVFAALACTGQSAQAGFVFTSSFENETPDPGLSKQYGGGSTIDGWTVQGNDVFLLRTNYEEMGNKPQFNAQDGNYSLDITGAGNTGANVIYRDFASVAGQQYELTFYVGRADSSVTSNYETPSTIGLSIEDAALLMDFSSAFTNSAVTVDAINWGLQQTVNFIGTGNVMRIAFQNQTPQLPTGNNFAGLDNIALAVPEPATVTMLGLGCLGGLIARRRKRNSQSTTADV